MRFPAIAVASLIVLVILVANSGAGSSLFRFVQLILGKDLTGHFGIYCALGFALSLCWKETLKFDVIWIGLLAIATFAIFMSIHAGGHRFANRWNATLIFSTVIALAGYLWGISSLLMQLTQHFSG